MEKLLILNPGSTSTKIAVFEDETPLFTESIVHSPEELAPFEHVAEQYEFRKELIVKTLQAHGVALESLTGIVSRGGLLTPIEAGAYEVNDDMVWQLKNKPQNEHASNVGAMIARAISVEYGIPANDDAIRSVKLLCDFVADAVIAGVGVPVTVTEMLSQSETADGTVVTDDIEVAVPAAGAATVTETIEAEAPNGDTVVVEAPVAAE